MIIRWLGHSCFSLTESTGTTVVADPYSEKITGHAMPIVNADVVTISHSHEDHCCVDRIQGEYKKIDTVGAFEFEGVKIKSIKCFHDASQGEKRGENLIFTYRIDGMDICHMGDIGEDPRLAIIESIGSVNFLLIPVGGKYTINAKQAKAYVDLLMPDAVIPMHYKTKDSDIDIDKVDNFLDLFDDEDIIYLDSDSVTVDRLTFSGETTKVLVFSR